MTKIVMAQRTRPLGWRVRERIATPWVVGVEVEGNKEKDTRTTESEDNVAAVPRQRRQKACWYFVTSRIKSATVVFTQEYSRVSYSLET